MLTPQLYKQNLRSCRSFSHIQLLKAGVQFKNSLSTSMQRAPKRRFRGPRNPKVLRRHLKAVEICLREEEEGEPLLIYTAQGSPFRCKKLSVINGSPERNKVLKLCIHMHYTNTSNNIGRKLCTNKRFKSK